MTGPRGQQDESQFGERWPSVIANPAAGAAAVATKAAVAGKKHQVTGLSITTDIPPTALGEATLVLGTTVVERFKIPVPTATNPWVGLHLAFNPPYTAADNEKAELTVPTLGGAVSAVATLRGRSIALGTP